MSYTKQQLKEYHAKWYKEKMKDPAFVAEKRKKSLEHYHAVPLEERRKIWNTDKYRATKREYARKNKPKIQEAVWARRGIIGITYKKYIAYVKRQNNKCKICKTDMKKPCVDHCHKTGKFRGVICNKCNLHLGQYERDKEMFERYLK